MNLFALRMSQACKSPQAIKCSTEATADVVDSIVFANGRGTSRVLKETGRKIYYIFLCQTVFLLTPNRAAPFTSLELFDVLARRAPSNSSLHLHSPLRWHLIHAFKNRQIASIILHYTVNVGTSPRNITKTKKAPGCQGNITAMRSP